MGDIVPFETKEEFQRDIEKLRVELSMLLLERDQLLYHVCPAIETAYLMRFGGLEYQVYQAECQFRRLKRKLALLIQRRNRQESIDLQQIEGQLDLELAEYQERLKEQLSHLNWALERSQREVLSEDESRELKSLYRKIVKKLHPDLHPELSQEELDLFHQAVTAYEDGNLAVLQVIAQVMGDSSEELSGSLLVKEKERLEELTASLTKEISDLKKDYPYTLKILLEDEEACQGRLAVLTDQLEKYQALCQQYDKEISLYV
ncbi:J domain-containing protein [Streptococcus sp. DD13]|uniref:J domain-containing protein n=1 Tax=Streptococcus sp. DD13 TaxID=1777881 RepID=UPI000794FEF9|nr:J domain-containing protein [Streptococcus sp. DD13]KXT79081.1 hypothetical protein STRDD13_00200 [Streptococcus sp. DD13]